MHACMIVKKCHPTSAACQFLFCFFFLYAGTRERSLYSNNSLSSSFYSKCSSFNMILPGMFSVHALTQSKSWLSHTITSLGGLQSFFWNRKKVHGHDNVLGLVLFHPQNNYNQDKRCLDKVSLLRYISLLVLLARSSQFPYPSFLCCSLKWWTAKLADII